MTRRIDPVSLSFLVDGCASADSISGFTTSEIGRYLEQIYGELEFSEDSGTNFINVYQHNNRYHFYDSVFSDKCHSNSLVGYLYPKSIKDTTRRIIKSKHQHLMNLRDFGFCSLKHSLDCSGVVDKLTFTSINQTSDYEVPLAYLQHLNGGSDENLTIEELIPLRDEIFNFVKARFKDNHLITRNCIAETRIQKMSEGTSMIRHFGADRGEPYLMTAIVYYCPYKFEGRDLYGGVRSEEDVSDYLFKMNSSSDFNSYSEEPKDFKDNYSLAPSNTTMNIVSAFNPLYYHGVKEHIAGDNIYAIITDIRLK